MTAPMGEDPTAGIREAARRLEEARVELQGEVDDARARGVWWSEIGEGIGDPEADGVGEVRQGRGKAVVRQRLPGSAPLWCRIRHNWKPRAYWPGYVRSTCSRCEGYRP